MKLDYIPLEQAKATKRKAGLAKIYKEYMSYLQKLKPNESGRITLEAGDKPATHKNRLQVAAKELGINNLKLKRIGDVIFFYRE